MELPISPAQAQLLRQAVYAFEKAGLVLAERASMAAAQHGVSGEFGGIGGTAEAPTLILSE